MFAQRVLVVEDESLLRELLVETCNQHGFDTRGARSAAEARGLFHEFDPDLVVLDIDLGHGPTGADLGRVIEERHPDVAVLYLTRLPDLRPIGHAPSPRSSIGYLCKDSVTSISEFIACVHDMFRAESPRRRDDLDPERPLAILTDAQFDVLRLASAGLSNRAIAEVRSTSESAVEAHFTAIFRVLEIAPSRASNQRATAINRYVDAVGRPIRPAMQVPALD